MRTASIATILLIFVEAINDQCQPTYNCSLSPFPPSACSSWPFGTTCQGSSCVPPSCSTPDLPCPDGQFCDQNNECQSYPTAFQPCNWQCAAGLYCSYGLCLPPCDSRNASSCPSGTMCESGNCQIVITGGGCGNNGTHISKCSMGFNCTGTRAQIEMLQGACLPYRPRGCSCQNDQQCISNACYQGSCLDTGLKVGQSCLRDGQCASKNCTNGVCVGFDCSICGNQECESYYQKCHPWCNYAAGQQYSSQQNICITPQQLGGPCNASEYVGCERPLSCYSPRGYGDPNGTCQPFYYGSAPVGTPCNSDYACSSRLCRNSICSNDFNLPCNVTNQCPNNYYCSLSTKTCAPYRNNANCSIDDDCGYSDGSWVRCLCRGPGVSRCENRDFGGGSFSISTASDGDLVIPPEYEVCGQVMSDNTTLLTPAQIDTCRTQVQALLMTDGAASPSAYALLNPLCARFYALSFCCYDCIGEIPLEFVVQTPLYPTMGLSCATLTFAPTAPGTFCDVPTELQTFKNTRAARCDDLLRRGIPLILSGSGFPTTTPSMGTGTIATGTGTGSTGTGTITTSTGGTGTVGTGRVGTTGSVGTGGVGTTGSVGTGVGPSATVPRSTPTNRQSFASQIAPGILTVALLSVF